MKSYMRNDTVIATIRMQISTIEPDRNGRIFDKSCMDKLFREHGYLISNRLEQTEPKPFPVRFFKSADDYRDILTRESWNVDKNILNVGEFTINRDIPDKDLSAMQIMFLDNRYYLNIPIPREMHEKYKNYLGKCQAHYICTNLEQVEGTAIMKMVDILYLDIYPDDWGVREI